MSGTLDSRDSRRTRDSQRTSAFQRLALATVFATLFLIFVGGLVRASGAGLGCPDWPKCFGVWIPPTNVADLPAGWDPAMFNPVHTWLEYVNRLVGVVIGLLITATFVLSLRHLRKDPVISVASFLAFALVLFQGWLGGQVVRSGLHAGMITIHMVLAFLIVNVLLFATYRAFQTKAVLGIPQEAKKRLLGIAALLLLTTLVQLVLGTQVRESVDLIKNGVIDVDRAYWLDTESVLFLVHRSFSWLILLLAAALAWVQRSIGEQSPLPGWFRNSGLGILAMVLLQILIGIGLERLGLPGALQVLHLAGVAVMLCLQFAYVLVLWLHPREQVKEFVHIYQR